MADLVALRRAFELAADHHDTSTKTKHDLAAVANTALAQTPGQSVLALIVALLSDPRIVAAVLRLLGPKPTSLASQPVPPKAEAHEEPVPPAAPQRGGKSK